MNKFKKIETGIEGLVVIEPTVFGDERGFFLESYSRRDFKNIGIEEEFVQDNHSKSKKGVLRGLHFQWKHAQGKLVRVTAGSVWDVAVDLRRGSSTYGKWYGLELSAKNKKQFYIPKGFAHGFLTLEDNTEFLYKCTDLYYPQYDSGVLWNDSDINIEWPLEQYGIKEEDLLLSAKDKIQQSLKNYTDSYLGEYVLLTGANGQLGYDFQRLFDGIGVKYLATDYKELDITNEKAIRDLIEKENFTVVINCAAYNNVDKAEEEKEFCYQLNAYSPELLAKITKEKNIEFVTYSTDFVFDGEKEIPYTEEDKPNPLSEYSKAKTLGEELTLAANSKSFVIRTSWVFGIANNNFNKQVIGWSKTRDKLNIVDDQVSVPTYSKDLAIYSWKLIQTSNYGLYNLCNSGEASKYEQAEYLLRKLEWKGEVGRAKTSDFPLPAKRAKYSKMSSDKAEKIIGLKMPHWKDAIDRFIVELKEKGEI